MRRRLGLAAIALSALGCATTAATTGGAEPSELREMKARILELQRAVTVHEVEIERLRRELAALGRSGASEPSSAAPPAPERPRAPERSAEPAPPRWEPEPVEDSDLELQSAPAAQPVPPAPASAPRPAAEPTPPAAQELYDSGYTLYHQGRWVDAEASFQRFLQGWPGSDLADNARYWMGESRLARGDVAGALAAFRETVERYPTGNKVPDAMLKAGDCLARLGDVEGARAQYAEVVRRFPSTAAAAMAEERRAKLR